MRSKYDSISLGVIRARAILKELDLRLPSELDIEAIAALRGVYVVEEALKGCEGRMIRKGHTGIISVKKDLREASRKRFTIAHELGHFESNDNTDIQSMICLEKDVKEGMDKGGPSETEANQFASELLLPEFMFKPKCDKENPSFSLIQSLANEFRTSLTATALRYMDFSPHRCALVLSRECVIQWCKFTEDFGYRMEWKTRLDADSLAADFFSGQELPREMFTVPASAWIQNSRLSNRAVIKEQSWLIYDSVLSLIWLDPVFEKEEN